jgi:hypothetical protein
MRLAHLSTVDCRHHPSPKDRTHLTDMGPRRPRSRKATIHTTDMAHTNITDVLVVVAAADVAAHGEAAASSDLPLVLQLSCKI